MYENATTVQFLPGKVDEALCILRASIVPVLKAQQGLLSLCLLPDRDADKITVIGLWESEVRARAAEAMCAYRKEIEKLDSLLLQGFVYTAREKSAPYPIGQSVMLN